MARSQTTKAPPEENLRLNMRITPTLRDVIDRAAELVGMNRNDFMLEASARRATEILLDRSVFIVSPETHAACLARLDAPAVPNGRLRQTMMTKAPWEQV